MQAGVGESLFLVGVGKRTRPPWALHYSLVRNEPSEGCSLYSQRDMTRDCCGRPHLLAFGNNHRMVSAPPGLTTRWQLAFEASPGMFGRYNWHGGSSFSTGSPSSEITTNSRPKVFADGMRSYQAKCRQSYCGCTAYGRRLDDQTNVPLWTETASVGG